ncbi:MAG: hypothetical protein AAB654_19545, partial [Acidobacteriota bacterium]
MMGSMMGVPPKKQLYPQLMELPAMTPEALEWHRFERDRAQALTVVAIIALPIAAFGIIDYMMARSGVRLAILWSVRGAALIALGALW